MATVVAPAHRHHAFWLRIVEDLALVFTVAAVAWFGFVGVVVKPTSWRDALPRLGMNASPQAIEPLSIVAASRPMLAAVAAATSLEERGVFGAEAAAAWRSALDECRRLAVQPIARSHGEPVLLWLLEAERERAEELAGLISAAATSPENVAALTVLRAEAISNADHIQRYRDIVNFDHWKAVCELGVSADGLEAREAGWMATHADDEGRLGEAQDAHEASFRAWRRVLDAQPTLLDDALVVEDLAGQIDRYRTVLAEKGVAFPASFILQDVVARSSAPAG
ncbi:MAG: hypothetical protein WCR51_00880 [Planctomycetia bacterium]